MKSKVITLVVSGGVLWLVFRAVLNRRVSIVSDLTGRRYEVLNGPRSQEAADALARLEINAEMFLERAEIISPFDRRIANIRERWSKKLHEISSSGAASTTSKRDIAICVRDKNGEPYDPNTSMYVLLHELAHVASDSYDHGTEFWNNFRSLLEIAEKAGVYTYVDYSTEPVTYCGTAITGNPMTCLKKGFCVSSL
jgi:hypothetical protein